MIKISQNRIDFLFKDNNIIPAFVCYMIGRSLCVTGNFAIMSRKHMQAESNYQIYRKNSNDNFKQIFVHLTANIGIYRLKGCLVIIVYSCEVFYPPKSSYATISSGTPRL